MVLAGEIEELRTQLEAAERARKAAEGELHEASDRVGDLSNANSSLATQKRKLENDIQAMQVGNNFYLTLSTPAVPNCCCSKGPAPHWSNPPFLLREHMRGRSWES